MVMKKLEVKQKGKVVRDKDIRKEQEVWRKFAEKEQLSEQQLAAFKKYYELLISHNQRYNLSSTYRCFGGCSSPF